MTTSDELVTKKNYPLNLKKRNAFVIDFVLLSETERSASFKKEEKGMHL